MENDKYINRELSWLDFNARVLQEASDSKNPLLERFKYLGIFSNNRDEFFRVRVSTLKRMQSHKKISESDKQNLTNILSLIQDKVAEQEEVYTKTYKSLIKEAKRNNIYLVNESELLPEQQVFVRDYFNQKVRRHIFPLMLGSSLKYNNFKDHSLYLAIELKDSNNIVSNGHALIELPTRDLPRFVQLPDIDNKKYLIFLEDIVRYNLDSIFSIQGYDIINGYIVKLTRESELDIDNDVLKSFLEIMSESVKKRKKAPPVRFIYDKEISRDLLEIVLQTFGIKNSDNLRAGGRYHNLKDFMDFPVDRPDLKFKSLSPIDHPELPDHLSKFDILKKKDVLTHYPYHSFSSLTSFIWEASIDPNVRAIKMTFYRVSRNSVLMRALINAARNGKKVTVFMEVQARFDEEDNIYWAEKLQEEGVRIIPTIPGFKVHSKLILIRRREGGQNVYYANISTGNFHETTARIYSDVSLLTSNSDICQDVNNVFYLFETKFKFPKFKKLKVAPFGIRSFIDKKIDTEIKNAKEGKDAWFIFKINNLVDEEIVDKVYKAAESGVKIKLIIRGICVLKTGFVHKNIEAFGVVDRFLEHSRIFVFANDGDPQYYISSADLMPRNLDHRIEVVCPILSTAGKLELKDIIDIQLKDNVKARELQGDKVNTYIERNRKETHQSQLETYKYFKNKADKF